MFFFSSLFQSDKYIIILSHSKPFKTYEPAFCLIIGQELFLKFESVAETA